MSKIKIKINFFVFFLLILTCLSFKDKEKNDKAEVTVFYGLNESHSNDWAQISNNGDIGVVYFNKQNNNLIYKTIQEDGNSIEELITVGPHLEISVFLFDSYSNPHVFAASSTSSDQTITHYYKNGSNSWENEIVINFNNEGGKFIYELSAVKGLNDSFHLLALKTKFDPDSYDYYYAFIDAHLYYITNSEGAWQKELINDYDMIYTMDDYVKADNRQDIDVDKDGFVHIIYGEQIEPLSGFSPSRLQYATNKTGNWQIETAVNYNEGTRDDAGWFPSVCTDTSGTPYISYTYIERVTTGSAKNARLFLAKRIGYSDWLSEEVASTSDGYFGTDGPYYTGGLLHLKFDEENSPHIGFTDIASSHGPNNFFNLGNIRYAVKKDGIWDITSLYKQVLPNEYYKATEMYSLCLLMDENTSNIYFIGQELIVNTELISKFNLIYHKVEGETYIFENGSNITNVFDNPNLGTVLDQNYPNPFNTGTNISFEIPAKARANIQIVNIEGNVVKYIILRDISSGNYNLYWNGADNDGNKLKSGIYYYQLIINGRLIETKRMLLIE